MKNKAFTLIEWLVVTAFIVVLCGVFILAASISKKKTENRQVNLNLLEARQLMIQYYANKGNFNIGTCGEINNELPDAASNDCNQSWVLANRGDDVDGTKTRLVSINKKIGTILGVENTGLVIKSNDRGFVIGAPIPSTIVKTDGIAKLKAANWWCYDQDGVMKIYPDFDLSTKGFLQKAFNTIINGSTSEGCL